MRVPTRRRAALCLTIVALTAAACSEPEEPPAPLPTASASAPRTATPVALPKDNPAMADLIPRPVDVRPRGEQNFAITEDTRIRSDDDRASAPAEYLAGVLRPATGFELPVSGDGEGPAITLTLRDDDELGAEGYRLDVTRDGVTLAATSPAGLFNGAHTLRQLLPADVERREAADRDWVVAGGEIVDRPRFAYRGAMLDVARHFFDATTVKLHIDRLAQYKINYLHLHLADDQGWRIEIKKWPKLTSVGGRTQVGGGKGGFYTQKQFREIVTYAASRGVTIVPEVDMPGHTNAALHAYPELNCDGKPRPAYTGTQVGQSSLCIDKDVTYRFARDVIGELAELTDGPYLHIGGDEAQQTSDADYSRFFARVLPMITKAGKRPIGWHEYANAELPKDSVVQYWRIETENAPTSKASSDGRKVVMSPASKTYLDMKYAESDPWGNKWAGPVGVRTAYDWDPATFLPGVGEKAVLGVETPLWTELVETEGDIERMAFPRVQAIAEVGWTGQAERGWAGFRKRLAAQADRMDAQDIAFHRSPEIDW